ncbi:putative UDP-N-acetylglucosamine pyrophosphorylase [Paratrimastix pyriformis]|uniref:histone acetyltransferase n=1 Tax=Paratrimastix pyriformis TaxID=342808 RepID=A0ABQ8UGN5_9EUKA|nr:putative UDP-N-acetylglucosamine pyrophosphorylase [Paratrimastix pyriformis]
MQVDVATRAIRELLHLPLSADDVAVRNKCEELSHVTFADAQPLLDGIHTLSSMNADTQRSYRRIGLEAISRREVGIIIMAGGQGTRLGSDKIKGAFDIQLPSHKSLFQVLCERMLTLQRLAGPSAIIPLYVMTCDLNETETRIFFEEHNFFGLDPTAVLFFSQGVLPCVDMTTGGFLRDENDMISASPNGNGGIYQALSETGMLRDMTQRGVKYLHAFSIDNILCKVADPLFMGLCISQHADCAAKVITKRHPHERMGVLCRDSAGRPGVVEYSEITEEQACLRIPGPKGACEGEAPLAFRGACICNHFYSLEFLQECVQLVSRMKLHIAKKQVPFREDGRIKQPTGNNAFKIELFFFDVLEFTRHFCALEVGREEEFSPVKNATGGDSPQTARDALSALHARWLEAAGGRTTGEGLVEISPLLSYEGENLNFVAGKSFQRPSSSISPKAAIAPESEIPSRSTATESTASTVSPDLETSTNPSAPSSSPHQSETSSEHGHAPVSTPPPASSPRAHRQTSSLDVAPTRNLRSRATPTPAKPTTRKPATKAAAPRVKQAAKPKGRATKPKKKADEDKDDDEEGHVIVPTTSEESDENDEESSEEASSDESGGKSSSSSEEEDESESTTPGATATPKDQPDTEPAVKSARGGGAKGRRGGSGSTKVKKGRASSPVRLGSPLVSIPPELLDQDNLPIRGVTTRAGTSRGGPRAATQSKLAGTKHAAEGPAPESDHARAKVEEPTAPAGGATPGAGATAPPPAPSASDLNNADLVPTLGALAPTVVVPVEPAGSVAAETAPPTSSPPADLPAGPPALTSADSTQPTTPPGDTADAALTMPPPAPGEAAAPASSPPALAAPPPEAPMASQPPSAAPPADQPPPAVDNARPRRRRRDLNLELFNEASEFQVRPDLDHPTDPAPGGPVEEPVPLERKRTAKQMAAEALEGPVPGRQRGRRGGRARGGRVGRPNKKRINSSDEETEEADETAAASGVRADGSRRLAEQGDVDLARALSISLQEGYRRGAGIPEPTLPDLPLAVPSRDEPAAAQAPETPQQQQPPPPAPPVLAPSPAASPALPARAASAPDTVELMDMPEDCQSTSREHVPESMEKDGVLRFVVVRNNGETQNMVWLVALKNLFARQLPRMPREYIVRLVFDRNHHSMVAIKNYRQIIGGITFRVHRDIKLGEIAFCAVDANEQVRGYGTRLMNHLKEYSKSLGLRFLLTYADNFAIGYFRKQGFTREITTPREIWGGYVKDYDGSTMMECLLYPTINYLTISDMIQRQKQAIYDHLRRFVPVMDKRFPGLPIFQDYNAALKPPIPRGGVDLRPSSPPLFPASPPPEPLASPPPTSPVRAAQPPTPTPIISPSPAAGEKLKRRGTKPKAGLAPPWLGLPPPPAVIKVLNPEMVPGVAGCTVRPPQVSLRYLLSLNALLASFHEALCRMPFVTDFLEPVTLAEAPDYYEHIANPLDLRTVQLRIASRRYYRTPEMYAADIRRICANCRSYNASQTPFYKHANELERYLDEKMKNITWPHPSDFSGSPVLRAQPTPYHL